MRAFFYILAAASVASAKQDLVLTAGDEVPGAVDYFNGLYKGDADWVVSVRSLDISASDVADAASITFPNGEKYDFNGEPNVDGEYHSYDLMEEGSDAEADLTCHASEDWVEGSVEGSDGSVFMVETVPIQLADKAPPAGHLWLETTADYAASIGSDDESGASRSLTPAIASTAVARPKDRAQYSWISIKVYYTIEYSWVTSDVRGKIDHMIAKTNQGLQDTWTDAQLELICIEQYTGGWEYWNSGQMLNAFRNHKSRAELMGSADMVMLVQKESQYGGQVFAIGDPSEPIAIVPKLMAEDYYNFGHEIGHLLGGWHNCEQLGGCNTGNYNGETSYAHGKFHPQGTNKVTIMSYPQDWNNDRLINYYAGADFPDNEGTITGTAAVEDVKRRIEELKNQFVANGDESQRCQEYPDCKDLYDINSCTYWVSLGYCSHSYPTWMATNCRKSCGHC